jgi:membrane associated rhomboid family serine protease
MASRLVAITNKAAKLFLPDPKRSKRPSQEIINFISKHGTASTSFLSLYDGYSYFGTADSPSATIIAYSDTASAFVGAGEPVGNEELALDAVKAWSEKAAALGKGSILLPVSQKLALKARQDGFVVIRIGTEPWYSLAEFDYADSLNKIANAGKFKAKGPTVETLDLLKITERDRHDLDRLIEQWLESRPSIPLAFLNKVETWSLIHFKKCFRVTYKHQTVGFLGAVPICGGKRWYLVDLIRKPGAPIGTSELLIISAMEQLKNEGALEVTLGLSPLAGLGGSEAKFFPRVYRFLQNIFENSQYLYGFKKLYKFKCKMRPTRLEPMYAIVDQRNVARSLYGLYLAYFPAGLVRASWATFVKKLGSLKPESIFSLATSDRLVLRSLPQTFNQFARSSKFVIMLAVLNTLFFFISVDSKTEHVTPWMQKTLGFSVQGFLRPEEILHHMKMLLYSSLLHNNIPHIVFNLTILLIFGSYLEVVAGSMIVVTSYLLGILLVNPATTLLIYSFLSLFHPGRLEVFTHRIDIGCSLGVFACLGALSHYLKRTSLLLLTGSLMVAISVFVSGNLLELNHIFALYLGAVIAHFHDPKSETKIFAAPPSASESKAFLKEAG